MLVYCCSDDDTISVNDEAALKNLTLEEVKDLVRQQLEFYFSRENLMYDKYLSSQMDVDNYVPIATLSTFNRIKRYQLTQDSICEAVEESPLLQLDSTRSKIRAASKRCVIILREIDSKTEVNQFQSFVSVELKPYVLFCLGNIEFI